MLRLQNYPGKGTVQLASASYRSDCASHFTKNPVVFNQRSRLLEDTPEFEAIPMSYTLYGLNRGPNLVVCHLYHVPHVTRVSLDSSLTRMIRIFTAVILYNNTGVVEALSG